MDNYSATHSQSETSGLLYYWIVADYQGKLVIIGPRVTEQEANEFGYQKLDVPFEVVPLRTKSRSTAGAQVKARRLESSADLGQSIQKSMRKAPDEYKNNWWGDR